MPHVPADRQLLVEAGPVPGRQVAEIEVADDGPQAEVERFPQPRADVGVGNGAGTEALYPHADRARMADGIAQLYLALLGQPRRHHVLGGIAGHVGADPIHPRGILAAQGRSAVAGVGAIGVGGGLAAGHAGVRARPALRKRAARIDEDLAGRVRLDRIVGEQRLDDVGQQMGAQLGPIDRPAGHAAGDDGDAGDPGRAVVVVLDADLHGAVRRQIAEPALLARPRQAVRQPVGHADRQRHQFRRLPAGIAEYGHLAVDGQPVQLGRAEIPLVGLCPLFLGHGDEAGQYRTVGGVEILLPVADLAHHRAGHLRDVDVGLGREAGGQEQHVLRQRAFGDDARVGILLQKAVDHRVADAVAEPVGMAIGDGFGGEEKATGHGVSGVRAGRRPLAASLMRKGAALPARISSQSAGPRGDSRRSRRRGGRKTASTCTASEPPMARLR